MFHLLCVSLSIPAVRSTHDKSNGNDNSGSGDSGDGTINAKAPTVELIEALGTENVYWTAAQLELMTADTFKATVDTLGEITGYSAAQLAVLSQKATEVEWRHWS